MILLKSAIYLYKYEHLNLTYELYSMCVCSILISLLLNSFVFIDLLSISKSLRCLISFAMIFDVINMLLNRMQTKQSNAIGIGIPIKNIRKFNENNRKQ